MSWMSEMLQILSDEKCAKPLLVAWYLNTPPTVRLRGSDLCLSLSVTRSNDRTRRAKT